MKCATCPLSLLCLSDHLTEYSEAWIGMVGSVCTRCGRFSTRPDESSGIYIFHCERRSPAVITDAYIIGATIRVGVPSVASDPQAKDVKLPDWFRDPVTGRRLMRTMPTGCLHCRGETQHGPTRIEVLD